MSPKDKPEELPMLFFAIFSKIEALPKIFGYFGIGAKLFWQTVLVSGIIIAISFFLLTDNLEARISKNQETTLQVIERNQDEIIGKIDDLKRQSTIQSHKIDQTNEHIIDLYKKVKK